MADECQELVRQTHRDRYLSALFAPDRVRPNLFALYAFDAEIARIPALVSEPQIGEIRFQWWLDTLDAIFDNSTADHPVAQALATAIKQANLPREPLRNMIEARTRELYADPMPSLNELEGYLGETRSMVFQLAAQIINGGEIQGISEAAGLAGVAQGIAELLERKPELPHEARHLLPAVSTPELIEHASKRLISYYNANKQSHIETRLAFLPMAAVAARLAKLKRNGQGSRISPLRAQWLIWRASR